MKNLLAIIAVGVLGIAVGGIIFSRSVNARRAAELAEQQAAWQAEKAELEAAIVKARRRTVEVPVASTPTAETAPSKLSPAEIVAQLVALKPSANNPRAMRKAIYWLEELIAAGPAALPAIRQFLNRNEEIDFTSAASGRRGPSTDGLAPVSLRFALFDAAKQIGGPDAEQVLAEVLGTTGRGVEVAWLARTLQEMAPNKYRDAALAAARELLGRPVATNPQSAIDRDERDQLYSVLTMYGDNGYVSTAQAQLLRATGEIDRSALKYLQQTLGPQSVTIAAQLYDDPRLKGPENKEPLARLALSFVGHDAQANQFYEKTINDLTLTKSHRSNLIEDLNEDGLNYRNLTPNDVPIIRNRLALIEQLAPHAADAVNAAAFKEAHKDLVNMLDRASRQAAQ
jgi:hypothetical protein